MIIAGIVAGGTGQRMGAELPKQFLPLNERPVLVFTAEQFLKHSGIDAVIIGINPEWRDKAVEQVKKHIPEEQRVFVTCGGSDRNETVYRMTEFARSSLGASDEDIILTHDAVRPFVTQRIITDCIDAMVVSEICTAAVPETDTVLSSQNGVTADSFPERRLLYRVQTPQVFRLGTFHKVYGSLSPEERLAATDVCRLYQSCGYSVRIVNGDNLNFKLTFPLDYTLAQSIVCSHK